MLLNLKALVVVMFTAFVVFILAKPVCLRFTDERDFTRRRNVWFALTVTGFLSPSFWLYVLVASPVLFWAARKDSSPLGLYLLMMFVIPPLDVRIPTVGIGQLFDLNNVRLLTLVVLLPATMRALSSPLRGPGARFTAGDFFLLSLGVLQLVLLVPYEALTNTMRRGFLFCLDTYIVYFAFSRLLDDRGKFADAMSTLCLATAIFAPLAAFESARSWLLYIGIGEIWGSVNRDAYLLRGDSLRAQAAAGHSITLGYLFAMALGFWLYLRRGQRSRIRDLGFLALMVAGLFFTFARGPWVMAAVIVLAFMAISSPSVGGVIKQLFWVSIVTVVVALTPYGAKFVDNLPFIGNEGQDSVTYRQRLAEVSWSLIQQHPFFGNPFVMLQMEELRPGEGGIIDLVNGYAQIALFYGLIGLAFYVGVFVVALAKSFHALRVSRKHGDVDMSTLGSAFVACMLSTMVFIATAGQGYLQWLLAGMMVSYAAVVGNERLRPVAGSSDVRTSTPRRLAT